MTWSIKHTNLYICEIKVSSLLELYQAYHLKEVGKGKWSKKLEYIIYYYHAGFHVGFSSMKNIMGPCLSLNPNLT